MPTTSATVRGPYFDELQVGAEFADSPAITLTPGLAAAHHAIVGNRLRLALDDELCASVTGRRGQVSPALVWDISIGQSTAVTQQVRANLFYRGLQFQRHPGIGDTLRTVTTVDALRGNRHRPGRARTGMAALHIVTSDPDLSAGLIAGAVSRRESALAARENRDCRSRDQPSRRAPAR